MIRQTAKDVRLPASIATSFQGNAQACQSSIDGAPILIVGALVAVYRIRGMLYESVIRHHRLNHCRRRARRAADPEAVRHAARRLRRRIILLSSSVTKSGILLVDFALERERARLSSEDFIHQVCRLRFRPILMTTLCALLGGAPLMVGTGTGREIRQPFGYAIVGGLRRRALFCRTFAFHPNAKGSSDCETCQVPTATFFAIDDVVRNAASKRHGADVRPNGSDQASAIWNGDRASTRR